MILFRFRRPIILLATVCGVIVVGAPAFAAAAGAQTFSGNVSWYGDQFQGKKTASGELFDTKKKTAAHLKLPFYTKVMVEDPKTGNTVIVKVNDRGPYVHTRVMDLSRQAAKELGTMSRGIAYVDCTVIEE